MVYREAELYDLDHDPYELVNLAGTESHRELSSYLSKLLTMRISEYEQLDVEIIPSSTRPTIGQRKVSVTDFS